MITPKPGRTSQWDRNYVGMDQPFDPTPCCCSFPKSSCLGPSIATSPSPGGAPGGVGIKPQQPDFASDEWIWLSLDVAPYHYRQLWRGGMRAGEENWVHLHQKLHPAQKPIDLLKRLVEQTSPRGP